MRKRLRFVAASLPYGVAVLALALAGPPAQASDAPEDQKKPATKETSGADVFDLTRVWVFHLDIPAKEYTAMQPPGGGMMRFPGGPGGPGKPPDKPPEKPGEPPRDSDRSAFGVEFPWVHGEFIVEGTTYKNVGLRYKGNSTYMASSRGLKRSIKVELDHYDEELRFHGLKTLNLHCGVMDQTKGREALAYAVFRAAGVPAPCTAFAEVTLTVPGKYDKEYLGLYIVVEQVDRRFLNDRFQNDKGLLMKPERVRGLDYLGENWDSYQSRFQPKREPTKQEARRVIEFVRLINKAGDEEFQKEIASYLDVDAFLRFMAANTLLVNMDSFFTLGHNYYLHLHPATNQFVFIPWDLDLSLGNFAMMGSADQLMDLNLTRPYAGNRLVDRLLAIDGMSEKYRKVVEELARTVFTKERLLKDVEAIEKTTKDLIAKEAKAVAARKEGAGGLGFGPPGGGMFGRSPDLRTFVDKRTASVEAQLAGKSQGYVPRMGFGPGGPGGPGGFRMGNAFARPLLEALDADKDGKVKQEELVAGARKFFEDCDKEKKGTVEEKVFTDGLSRLFPRPPGFGPPGKPPAGKPPGGGPIMIPRGPAALLAGAGTRRADADKDGKVTLAELLTAAEALFKEADKDKDGSLDEKEVAAGIDLLAPPPPGFGPPAAKPEEPRKEEKKP
jgi:spore coat protein CotH